MRTYKVEKNNPKVYFAQLMGMSNHISHNLANEGYNVLKYMPYGPIKDMLPYLIRRAEENKSISGQSGRELNFVKKELNRRSSAT
jgi:proline dehydrogenase